MSLEAKLLEELREIERNIQKEMESFRRDLQRKLSPWLTQKEAAIYVGCSEDEVRRAANEGKIKRFFRNNTPMFKKSDHEGSLDAWIDNAPMPESRKKRILK